MGNLISANNTLHIETLIVALQRMIKAFFRRQFENEILQDDSAHEM